MACPVSRANRPWMNGDQLWPTGCPTTPYRSVMGPRVSWGHCAFGSAPASRRASQGRDARAARVAGIEPCLQLGQPEGHALGQLVRRIDDQHTGAVARPLGIPGIQPQLTDQGFAAHSAGKPVVPGTNFALVLDRMPCCIDAGAESL